MGLSNGLWLRNRGYTVFGMYFTVGGAIVNIAANFVLIPSLGGMGAAIATVVSYAVSGMFLSVVWRKTRPLFFGQLNSSK